ncbi:hypothetical protein AeRB84_012407 [Aphanomyces euteiches]|nr:hypothetical protein AeRB84_012407 [Aphanomyces euteiches]
MSAHHKYLDYACASLSHNPLFFPQGFFGEGWGDVHIPSILEKRITDHHEKYAVRLIDSMDLEVIKSSPLKLQKKPTVTISGRFKSTLRDGDVLLPPESQQAYFELIVPESMLDRSFMSIDGRGKSLVVILPGTGEHGCIHRRRTIAEPLARSGVASLVLEGAFYGKRKPKTQKGSKLRRVSDLPILGIATIEETKSLLTWFKEHYGFDHVVVAGSSMGGLHAAMTAALCPFDVGVASWIAPPSAVPAFTQGLLSRSCNWQSLHEREDLAVIDHLLSNQVDYYTTNAEDEIAAQVKKRLAAFLSITNIENFPTPRRPDAVVFSQATEDQYIGDNAMQWENLRRRWPGAQFRRVKAGHVSGILFETQAFVQTIQDVEEEYSSKNYKHGDKEPFPSYTKTSVANFRMVTG